MPASPLDALCDELLRIIIEFIAHPSWYWDTARRNVPHLSRRLRAAHRRVVERVLYITWGPVPTDMTALHSVRLARGSLAIHDLIALSCVDTLVLEDCQFKNTSMAGMAHDVLLPLQPVRFLTICRPIFHVHVPPMSPPPAFRRGVGRTLYLYASAFVLKSIMHSPVVLVYRRVVVQIHSEHTQLDAEITRNMDRTAILCGNAQEMTIYYGKMRYHHSSGDAERRLEELLDAT